MPTFLWFYVAGLGIALGVGFVFYFVVGAACGPFLERVFGEHAAYLWGRTFRLMLVMTALVGGLSTQWYGCHGYTDYEAVERDRRLMFQKTTEQVAGALGYTTVFLVGAANVGVIVYAFVWSKRAPRAAPPGGAVR